MVVHVKIRDGEPFEKAFKRFTKSFEKSGVLAELRTRERFEKPCATNRRERIQAQRKQRKITRMGIK
jgi:small subunit ribosomal protein S21